jgi:hypothetical protein
LMPLRELGRNGRFIWFSGVIASDFNISLEFR